MFWFLEEREARNSIRENSLRDSEKLPERPNVSSSVPLYAHRNSRSSRAASAGWEKAVVRPVRSIKNRSDLSTTRQQEASPPENVFLEGNEREIFATKTGLGESSHRQQRKTRGGTLPESTEGQPQAIERQVGGACFGSSPMAVVVEEPEPQGPLLLAHQG